MNKYELLFILKTDAQEERRAQILERLTGIIEGDGGQVENVDEWGNRKLAYEINKTAEGYYTLVNFDTPVDTPKELSRVLRITDDVMRHMIVRLEA